MTSEPVKKPFRLEQFVVYNTTTKDFPGRWVVRRFVLTDDPQPLQYDASPMIVTTSLEFARIMLLDEKPGLFRMPPMPGDDPVIEEVWI